MNLQLRARGVELTRALEHHVERHVRYALTRFASRVGRVRVFLDDVNGPRGGRDIECKVRVDLSGHQVLILERHEDPFAAIAHASDRVAFAIPRHLGRIRDRLRKRERLWKRNLPGKRDAGRLSGDGPTGRAEERP